MTTMDQLEEWKRIAGEASRAPESGGSWIQVEGDRYAGVVRDADDSVWVAQTGTGGMPAPEARAAHIATFDPPTVLALISRVEELERRHFRDEDWPLALQRLNHTEPGPDQGIAVVGVDDLAFALERLAHFASVAMGNAAEVGRLEARAQAAEARLQQVGEALRPFAEVGKARSSPSMRATWGFDGACVSDDDFRRAASALSLLDLKEGASRTESAPPPPPWPAGPDNGKREGWIGYHAGLGRELRPFPPARADLQRAYREGWDLAQSQHLNRKEGA
jgi:hypothetical protein